MKLDPQDYQQLDNYHKGLSKQEEIFELQARMNNDGEFKQEAEAYLELMSGVKFFGQRKKILQTLEEIHGEIKTSELVLQGVPKTSLPFKKYWRMTAIAASIIIVTMVSTLLITRSMNTKQTAYYKELRRNVDQIRKSQKQIMAELAESRGSTIALGKYSGTGFIISANGYVATSYHVIKEFDSISIENEYYGRLSATVVYSSELNDISILKITQPGFKVKKALPFTISNKEADLGEYVYTLGFPREDIVFGEGSVSATSGYGQNPDAYQVSVPVNPGNSGGPLLNSNGDLIGMVSGVQTETAGAAFAIKSIRLVDLVTEKDVLDSLTSPLILPKQNTIKNMNRVQQIKKWRELVFMVRVYKEK